MKLRIRYEDEFQYLELSEEETRQLCVSLSIENENPKPKEIQKAFDDQFNKPERNCFQKETRHIDPEPHIRTITGRRTACREDEDSTFSLDMLPAPGSEMPDFEYEDLCKLIKTLLKPAQADLIIAICIDGVSVSEYAEKEGVSQPAITQRLQTAKKILKKLL